METAAHYFVNSKQQFFILNAKDYFFATTLCLRFLPIAKIRRSEVAPRIA